MGQIAKNSKLFLNSLSFITVERTYTVKGKVCHITEDSSCNKEKSFNIEDGRFLLVLQDKYPVLIWKRQKRQNFAIDA